MCGIAGIFGAADRAVVVRMLDRMIHRGPDDGGVFADDVVAIGQRRLAIIDTSPAGHQPMATAGGDVQVVFNGEIYNYREARIALERTGRKFISDSDTEVVLALYERYGERFVERLRGIFAIAIYDQRGGPGREYLLLARDQFGIKPLLVHQAGGTTIFASELKALLASDRVERTIDPGSLRQLLSLGSVYQPRTLVKNVRNLPPAHYMVVDRSKSRTVRYWSYGRDRVSGLRRASYPEQVDRLRAVLRESVRLQMVADVPVGAFLSGGVDSSLIVAMMAQESSRAIKTFSVGFEDGANAVDETSDAAEIARYIGTDHTRVVVGSRDIAAQFERFVTGLDQPSVDGLNSYFVAGAAAQDVTVSLSGTGSDEVFLGYPWFAQVANRFPSRQSLDGRPAASWFMKLRDALSRSARPPALATGPTEFGEAFGSLYHCFGPAGADVMLSPGMRALSIKRDFWEDFIDNDELPDGEPLDRAGVMCLNGYTRNQLLRDIDACAMSHSLEVRVPFLDPVVIDHALSLPTASKLALSEQTLLPQAGYDESGVKRIVCDVARQYLPDTFFSNRAKKGFNLPNADWLKGPLAEFVEDTLSPSSVTNRGIFGVDAVAEVRREFREGTRPWTHVWILMVTELWHRQVLQA